MGVDVQADVLGIDAMIRTLLAAEGIVVADADVITVISAESEIDGNATNYRVVLDFGAYKDVVIEYAVDSDADTPSDARVVDLGTTTLYQTTKSAQGEDTIASVMSSTVKWIIIASVIAVVVFGGVAAVAMCMRRKKLNQTNEMYSPLNGNSDVIDQTL